MPRNKGSLWFVNTSQDLKEKVDLGLFKNIQILSPLAGYDKDLLGQPHPIQPKGESPHPLRMKMMGRLTTGIRLCFSNISVEPVLFLYMLATFSQYALFQDLVYSKVCWTTYTQEICNSLHSDEYSDAFESVQRTSSHWILMSTISMVIPSILIAIYLGSWSDKFGRKWPVVFPPLGGVLACVVYIILSFDISAPVGWICFASMLSGLSGGFVSCIMSCMTYVASISSEENRTVRISRLEAMIFLGGTIGPFLSGSMLERTGHGYVFIFMLVCYAAAFLYAILFVKEVKEGVGMSSEGGIGGKSPVRRTGDEEEERREGMRDAEAKEQRKGLLIPPKLNSKLENVPDVAVDSILQENKYRRSIDSSGSGHSLNAHEECSISSTTASDDEQRNILRRTEDDEDDLNEINGENGRKSCCSRYFGSDHFLSATKTVLKKREGAKRAYLWLIIIAGYITMMITAGELDVAYLFAKGEPLKWSYQIYSYYFGFKYGLGTLVLLLGMPLIQHLKIQDTTVCLLGIFSRMAGLILYALSPDTTTAFLVPVVAIFSFFTIPATRSLLSKLVSPDEQGKMFAFVAIMEDLCTMTASLLFNSIYPLTRPIFKGMIFLLAAALLLIPVAIMWFVRRRLSRLEETCSTSPSPTPTISTTVSHRRHSSTGEEEVDSRGQGSTHFVQQEYC